MDIWQDPYSIVGFVGGVVLALSLVPQIYLAHKRRSTSDISYLWQAVYIVGLIHFLVFYSHFELWTVIYPLAFELSSICYLTSLKVYFEVVSPMLFLPTGRSEKLVVGVAAEEEATAAMRAGAEGRWRDEAEDAGAVVAAGEENV